MHKSAMCRMKWFVDNYIPRNGCVRVLDVGSYDVNGSYKGLFDQLNVEYVGADMSKGPNVDVVFNDPYDWSELKDESFDFVISGNAFEHIEYPWLTIKEIYKKTKIGGFVCILAPNSIGEHRYPLDCYRYFSDGFSALAKWGGFTVVDVTVGGIPDKNISCDWYAGGQNDTMIIMIKGVDTSKIQTLPRMKSEKRYYKAEEMGKRCQFLIDWLNADDRKSIVEIFLKERAIKNVFLYGYGKIGKIIYRDLQNIDGITLSVMDRNPQCSQDIEVFHPDKCMDLEGDTCIFSSLFDPTVLEELKKLYPKANIYSIEAIFR